MYGKDGYLSSYDFHGDGGIYFQVLKISIVMNDLWTKWTFKGTGHHPNEKFFMVQWVDTNFWFHTTN